MYAVTGITGQVGGNTAHALLKAGKQVRAVVRSVDKCKEWAEEGCEIAVADVFDSEALAKAFKGTEGVFFMMPPNFDPEPGFPQIKEMIASVTAAIKTSGVKKVVFLSTVGAHVSEFSLLNNSKMMEEALSTLNISVGFLRAAWFMENAKWDVDSAKAGSIASFLQPADHPIPMVATKDIGDMAANMLGEHWDGLRIVELEGPQRYSAGDLAAAFAKATGHAVSLNPVDRAVWEDLFKSQGMKNPMARIRMIDGFNEGWIDFENDNILKGETPLDVIINDLVKAGRF